MDSLLKSRLKNIIDLSYKQNWGDERFSLVKAYICAELSSLVYEDVQEYELKKASRIHLFASKTYKNIIDSGKTNSILSTFSEANLDAQFFVNRSRYAVILGMCFNNVVILTVRGTVFRQLWDWKANVDAKKYFVKSTQYFHPHGFGAIEFDAQFFHKGFFESIAPQLPSIYDEIKKYAGSTTDLKIIWAGHSLGGAMAAIGNALSQAGGIYPGERIQGTTVVGAYTF